MNNNATEIKILRTTADVASIRSEWLLLKEQSNCQIINSDIDRFLSVIHSSKAPTNPYVILVTENNIPICVIASRRENHVITSRIGYLNIFKKTADCLTVVSGGVIGILDEDKASLILENMFRLMKSERFDMIYFSHLRTDSVLYRIIKNKISFLRKNHFPITYDHWIMKMPDSLEDFYKSCSKKHRGNLKRYIKKLDEDFPAEVLHRTFSKESEIADALKDAHEVSRTTYQYAMKRGLELESQTISLMADAAKLNRLRIDVLYIRAVPCSFQIGLIYKGRYNLYQIGHNPEYSKYNIGTVLFIKTLEQLSNIKDIKTMDFGLGDADYKQSYGTDRYSEIAAVYLFSSNISTITANIMCTLFSLISVFSEYITKKVEMSNLIKKHWRNGLIKLNHWRILGKSSKVFNTDGTSKQE